MPFPHLNTTRETIPVSVFETRLEDGAKKSKKTKVVKNIKIEDVHLDPVANYSLEKIIETKNDAALKPLNTVISSPRKLNFTRPVETETNDDDQSTEK